MSRKTLSRTAMILLALSPPAFAQNSDGRLDPGYATGGRNLMGFIESSTLELRAISESPSGRTWMFADDRDDVNALYVARLLANGQPDIGFGPIQNGRRRLALPSFVAQPHGFSLDGSYIQNDGKPVFFGGVTPANGSVGVFPSLVCRLNVAGNLDAGFGPGGCRLVRSFLSDSEICRVTDAQEDSIGGVVAIGNCIGNDLATRPFLTRLTAGGAIDFEFGAGAGVVTPQITQANAEGQYYEALTLRPDGRIAVLGHFLTDNAGVLDQDLGVLQFDTGGSLDPGFSGDGVALLRYDLGGDNAEFARDIELRNDGRLLVLGQTTTVSPPRTVAVTAQFLEAGLLDATFGTGGRTVDLFGSSLGTASNLRDLAIDGRGRAVVGGVQTAASSTPTSAGTSFWITFPRAIGPEMDARLFVTSAVRTSGRVSSAPIGISIPFSVEPGKVTTIRLPPSVYLADSSGVTSSKGLNVTSQAPITVHSLGGKLFNFDGALELPTTALGTNYRVMAWGEGLGEGSQLAVVGTQPNTSVTVTPSAASPGHPLGMPFTIPLQPGHAFKMATTSGDFTGTTVVANKPIAVYGGHSCGLVPNATVDFCEHLVEQQVPVERWGEDFFAAPFAGRTAGAVLRVLAHEANTLVLINDIAVATLPAGGVYQTDLTSAVRVNSDKGVSVVQYAKGCKSEPDPACTGDPTMITIAPTEHWHSRYHATVPLLLEPYQADYQHFIEIYAPTSVVPEIRINGVSVPPAAFTPIGSSGVSRGALPTVPGSHLVTSPRTQLSVNVYGFGPSEAYGFPAAGAPGGESEDTDDLILRYTVAGARDASFGLNGSVVLDHPDTMGQQLSSVDALQGIVVQPDGGIVVGSGVFSQQANRSFLLNYRLIGSALFRDGFEED